MQALRLNDGAGLTGSMNTYVWGWSSEVLPSHEIVYFVEQLPGEGAFDLSDRPRSPLQVYALVDGLWQSRGTFPVPGRPKMRQGLKRGPIGSGDMMGGPIELTLHDFDGDGLQDLILEDGKTWVGYSVDSGKFVVKNPK
jgi:hypothetical protein